MTKKRRALLIVATLLTLFLAACSDIVMVADGQSCPAGTTDVGTINNGAGVASVTFLVLFRRFFPEIFPQNQNSLLC